MAKKKPYEVGQAVKVLDTANDRLRDGMVSLVEGKTIHVYVERFKTTMTFKDGETGLGRFRLQ